MTTYYNIEPGYTDPFIDKIQETNALIGSTPSAPKSNAPRLAFMWPLTGQRVSDTQKFHVLASDSDAGSVEKVTFMVDGEPVGHDVYTPPYEANINTRQIQIGSHTIMARAFGAYGRTTDASLVVINGVVTERKQPTALTDTSSGVLEPM